MNSLEGRVQEARDSAEEALLTARAAYDRADEISSCMNAYMDVIGDWSTDVYSYYTYHYC